METMTLAGFLLARVTEDEAVARDALHPDAVKPGQWVTEHHNSEYHSEPNRAHIAEDRSGHYWSVAHEVFIPIAEHVARHDPARVLAECHARRQIAELATAYLSSPESGGWADVDSREYHNAEQTLHLLALPYADHPDYRQEWTP
jgi:hypothetical protein